ncbi:hypothetical protein PMHK_35350 [Pseudomonas sp. MHK4]|jgi:hypothetical protein
MCRPFRWQASAYRFVGCCREWRLAVIPVGAGLPAMAVGQARKMLAVSAFSLASQLLQVYWVLPELVSGRDPL